MQSLVHSGQAVPSQPTESNTVIPVTSQIGTTQATAAKASQLPLLLSIAALVLAAGAVGWNIYLGISPLLFGRDSRLRHYDLSSPRAALMASGQMILDNDAQAFVELVFFKDKFRIKELLATVKVEKELDFRGDKYLFYSCKEGGAKKYHVETFAKDANSGLWLPKDRKFSFTGADKELDEFNKKIRDWEENGRLP
jgi:hypothetical protein